MIIRPALSGPTASKTQGHSLLGEILFAFLGIGAFAIIAQTSDKIGKLLLYLMLGFLLIWFVIHGQAFSGFITKLQNIGQGSA